MTGRNFLLAAPPHQVEMALKQLGRNLRTARLRRSMTIAEAAERIGTGPRAVMQAEKGHPSSSIATYMALLWLYDLMGPIDKLADPTTDTDGLARLSPRQRARASRTLDNDF